MHPAPPWCLSWKDATDPGPTLGREHSQSIPADEADDMPLTPGVKLAVRGTRKIRKRTESANLRSNAERRMHLH
jgi:hypothetical protein